VLVARDERLRFGSTALRQAVHDSLPGALRVALQPQVTRSLAEHYLRCAERHALAGRREEARGALRLSVARYTELGAAADIRRADARLRRYGVRRGHGRSAPGSVLTATETAVADLVARGKSTPEIATELLLSPRTVQTHISHILRKLNSKNRTDIALAAGDWLPTGVKAA
jgi:DNA-binding NarL/FixJ family response regulator